MNWLAKKSGLIVLSALLFFSCENDDLLSLDFDPNDENLNLSFTEFTVPFKLAQLDSVATSNADNMLVGNYQNNNFGYAKSKAYIKVGIGNSSVNKAEDDHVLDSMVLVLVKNYFYGSTDGDMQQRINIHRLTEYFNDTLAYYRDSQLAYEDTPIGSFSFTANAEEPTDTLRIRLSETLGNELLDKLKANAAEIDSNALFTNYFKGIALVSETENTFASGFYPAISMIVYHSAPSDTVSESYSFGTSRFFNGIEYDRNGTVLTELSKAGTIGDASDGGFYMQAGTGVLPRLDFQPLLDFVRNNSEKVLLNRVILHIGLPEPPKLGTPPPSYLLGFQLEDDGISNLVEFSPVANQLIFSGLYNDTDYVYNSIDNIPVPAEGSPFAYDSASMSYEIKMTSFAQNLVDGYIDNSNVMLYPVNLSSSGVNRDLNDRYSQIVTEADSIRLKVYYTELK
ncbi:DUF4270 family protein [Porifericola rhodea]|uniref:DUF4270 family protein n=1 Tax=Porifericola rhodea TaxID=930972 RepID=UPI002665EF78|nr:DUF4270 family protein [Porifericola rhodea]WKN33038.1 DUF4270 family protein [Porifericola rhodea]